MLEVFGFFRVFRVFRGSKCLEIFGKVLTPLFWYVVVFLSFSNTYKTKA